MQTKQEIVRGGKFYFRGGQLALDFVNTVGDRLAAETRREYLATAGDVRLWIKEAGVVFAFPPVSGRMGEKEVRRARDFREMLYRVFRAHIDGGRAKQRDVEILNRALVRYRAAGRLASRGTGFAWKGRLSSIDSLLGVLAESAAELLTSVELGQVTMCAAEDCGWLFLDRSRSDPRKWCSMEDCGNREKQRRHQGRKG